MKEPLWICGKWTGPNQWEFQGIFSHEDKAVAACREWEYFVAPVVLDAEIPEGPTEWVGLRYPMADLRLATMAAGGTV